MGVQRGESSEVQKVSSDFKQIKLFASPSGPFQADLTATPAPSLCHTGVLLRSPGQVQGTHSVTHSGVRGSADPHRHNTVGTHRKGTAALSPSLTEPVCMRGPKRKA